MLLKLRGTFKVRLFQGSDWPESGNGDNSTRKDKGGEGDIPGRFAAFFSSFCVIIRSLHCNSGLIMQCILSCCAGITIFIVLFPVLGTKATHTDNIVPSNATTTDPASAGANMNNKNVRFRNKEDLLRDLTSPSTGVSGRSGVVSGHSGIGRPPTIGGKGVSEHNSISSAGGASSGGVRSAARTSRPLFEVHIFCFVSLMFTRENWYAYISWFDHITLFVWLTAVTSSFYVLIYTYVLFILILRY